MPKVQHETTERYIVVDFKNEDGFTLSTGQVNGGEVMNLIHHLAHVLEINSGITVEEVAERLVEDQGNVVQEKIQDEWLSSD